ncbi:MAG: adenylate/guanylate cyclase domain-containing protein [Myxococcota bacterium]
MELAAQGRTHQGEYVASADGEHKLAAILSADVVGYTRLMAEDEEATVRTLSAYRDEIGLLVGQHRGRVVDFPGDNLLAEFPTAIAAVSGAVSIQRVLAARNADLRESRRMAFRIGVHLGDVRVEGSRIYGDGVNIASRLEGLADPGGICISATVHEQVRNKLEVDYDDLGDQNLKNLPDPVHVFRVNLRPQVPAAAASTRSGARLAVAAAVVALALAAALVWRFLPSGTPTPASDVPSLAVLPFVNMSGDPEQEYFSDGLTEDLITDLSKVGGLVVIARNSSFTYKGKPVRVEEVGRELGVAYVLEGSVRKANDRVRITAQLVDASTGHHLWAERYDRRLEDIFALQDEVTREIVAALEVRLSKSEREQVDRLPTENLEAYDTYQRALVYGRRMGREANLRAQELLQRAIELDPEFGLAHAWLATALVGSWMGHWSEDPRVIERAEELVERALALDDTRPEALVAASTVYAVRGRNADAIAVAERAVALAPSSAPAHTALAMALNGAGRTEEGAHAQASAARLDPLDPLTAFSFAATLFGLREHERAVGVAKRAVVHTPDFIGLHGMLALNYAELGQMEEAREEVAEILRISPGFSLEELERRNLEGIDPELRGRMLAAAAKAGFN